MNKRMEKLASNKIMRLLGLNLRMNSYIKHINHILIKSKTKVLRRTQLHIFLITSGNRECYISKSNFCN